MKGLEIEARYEQGSLKLTRELPLQEGTTVRITIDLPAWPGVMKHGATPWTDDHEGLERLAMDPEFGIEESP